MTNVGLLKHLQSYDQKLKIAVEKGLISPLVALGIQDTATAMLLTTTYFGDEESLRMILAEFGFEVKEGPHKNKPILKPPEQRDGNGHRADLN